MSFKLAQLLTQEGVVTEDELELLDERREEQGDRGLTLDADLCLDGHCTPSEINRYLAEALKQPEVNDELLQQIDPPQLSAHWTSAQAQEHQLCPIAWDEEAEELWLVAPLPWSNKTIKQIIATSEELSLKISPISQIHFVQLMHRAYGTEIPPLLVESTETWPLPQPTETGTSTSHEDHADSASKAAEPEAPPAASDESEAAALTATAETTETHEDAVEIASSKDEEAAPLPSVTETPDEPTPAAQTTKADTDESPAETASAAAPEATAAIAEPSDGTQEAVATDEPPTNAEDTPINTTETVAEVAADDADAANAADAADAADAGVSAAEDAKAAAEAADAQSKDTAKKELDRSARNKAMEALLGAPDDLLDSVFGSMGSMDSLPAFPPLPEVKRIPPPPAVIEEEEIIEQVKPGASVAALDSMMGSFSANDLDAALSASFDDDLNLGSLVGPKAKATPVAAQTSEETETPEVSTSEDAGLAPTAPVAKAPTAPAPVAQRPVKMRITEVEELLELAHSRDAVLELGLFFAAGATDQAAVFMLPKGNAVGHYLHGAESLQQVFRSFSIPIDSDTIFQKIRDSIVPYNGPIPSTKADRFFFALFDPIPVQVYFFPVRLRGRNIAAIYCHQHSEELSTETFSDLMRCAHKVASALERVIIAIKQHNQLDDPADVVAILQALRSNDTSTYEDLIAPYRPDDDDEFMFEEPVMLQTTQIEEAPPEPEPAPTPAPAATPAPQATPSTETKAVEAEVEVETKTDTEAETHALNNEGIGFSAADSLDQLPSNTVQRQQETLDFLPSASNLQDEPSTQQSPGIAYEPSVIVEDFAPEEAPQQTMDYTNFVAEQDAEREASTKQGEAQPEGASPSQAGKSLPANDQPAAVSTDESPVSVPLTAESVDTEEPVVTLDNPKAVIAEEEAPTTASLPLTFLALTGEEPGLTNNHISVIRSPDGMLNGTEVVSAFTHKDGAVISSSPTLRDAPFLSVLRKNNRAIPDGDVIAKTTANIISQAVHEIFAQVFQSEHTPTRAPTTPPPPPTTTKTSSSNLPAADEAGFGAEILEPSRPGKSSLFDKQAALPDALPAITGALLQWRHDLLSEDAHEQALNALLQRPTHELIVTLLHAFPAELARTDIQENGSLSFALMDTPGGRIWNTLLDYPEETSACIVPLLWSQERHIRLMALMILRQLPCEHLFVYLLRLAIDPDPTIVRYVRKVLAPHRRTPQLTELLEWTRYQLNDEVPEKAALAITILREVRDPQAVPELIEFLETKQKQLAEMAASALIDITSQDIPLSQRKWRKWWKKVGSHSDRIDWLIEGIQQKDLKIVEAAIEELRDLTGLHFGFDPKAGKRERQASIQQWKVWHKQHS